MDPAPCQYLEWDSRFFGRRIGRITLSSVGPEGMAAALAWARQERIACLYFLSGSDDPESVVCVEDNGFRLTDVRFTFYIRLPETDTARSVAATMRTARPDDIDKLKEIAAVSHRQTRFYYDRRFDVSQCDRLYEMWIERSFEGYADRVFVAEAGGKPAGYITCSLGKEGTGVIGLLAVAAPARGMGLGRQLVEASLCYFKENRMSGASVVTQGRNYRSQRLYQSVGFRTESVKLWYHKWIQLEE